MDVSEDEESNIWSDVEVKEEGGQLAQAEEVSDLEAGHRLALTNMDWDNLNATDILALFTSLCKGDMIIEKVEIYPSLFGLEQMKKDTLYGPPKELFLTEEAKKLKKKRRTEAEEAEADEAYNQSKLRKYEIQKMKYFYAVIYCNSPKTCDKIYSEYNGFEFELSSLKLNLSYVADDLKFP